MTTKQKSFIPLSEYKKAINMFKDWNIDIYDYYKHILINNPHRWNFVNPMRCKSSFRTAYNMLKFCVLKRLIKQGYYLQPHRKDAYTFEYTLTKKEYQL